MSATFTLPSFLQGQSPEEIHKEMIALIPGDIDMSEGSDQYNITFPTAYEMSRFIQFILSPSLKLIWPQYCGGFDEQTDYHAECVGLKRKEALYASGTLRVGAKAGTIIPAKSVFSTETKNNLSAVTFKTTQETIYEKDEEKDIPIEAEEPGTDGNVAANTIVLKISAIDGITSITNPEPTTGGISGETTDELIERIQEFEQNQGKSNIGNLSDYKRWAQSVDGVGTATPISPETDDGTVTIVLTDIDGEPANDDICTNVYNYIMNPSSPLERLAPVNAKLKVISAQTAELTVSAYVNADTTVSSIETIKSEFVDSLKEYLKTAEEIIRYERVKTLLMNIEGVTDTKDFTINSGTENITIPSMTHYTTNENNIVLTAY